MPIRIAVGKNCPLCERLINHFKRDGQNYVTISGEAVLNGTSKEHDRTEILLALSENGMKVPVLQYPGREWDVPDWNLITEG